MHGIFNGLQNATKQKKKGGGHPHTWVDACMSILYLPCRQVNACVSGWLILLSLGLKLRSALQIPAYYAGISAHTRVCVGGERARERKESTSHVSDNKSTCKERPLATGCGDPKKRNKEKKRCIKFPTSTALTPLARVALASCGIYPSDPRRSSC